jgi:hypothetical protein
MRSLLGPSDYTNLQFVLLHASGELAPPLASSLPLSAHGVRPGEDVGFCGVEP